VKPITGPADVKIGDAVSLTTVNSYGVVGWVVKVGAESLSIRTEAGDRRTAKYKRRASRGWRTVIEPQFRLLNAHDVWRRKRPATPMLDSHVGDRSGFRAAAHDLAARTALHAEVDALADWYAAEPSGDAP
jgi:hypothetical protein